MPSLKKKEYAALLKKEKQKFEKGKSIEVPRLGRLLLVHNNSEDKLKYCIGGKGGTNSLFIALPEAKHEEFPTHTQKPYEIYCSALKKVLHTTLIAVPELNSTDISKTLITYLENVLKSWGSNKGIKPQDILDE